MAHDAQALFDHLWLSKYLPRYREERALARRRRAEAFVAGPRRIGAWSLRVMTAYDALLFEGADSPFVTDDPARATPEDVAWALWHLRADTRPRWFPALARDRQILRWRHAWLARGPGGELVPTPAYLEQLAAFLGYLEDVFADSQLPRSFKPAAAPSAPAEPPPALGTHWLASHLVELATEMGPTDPISGLAWAHVPLPQIWQYRRELRTRQTGKPCYEDGAPAAVKGDCLDEVNAILRGEIPSPLEDASPLPAPCSPL